MKNGSKGEMKFDGRAGERLHRQQKTVRTGSVLCSTWCQIKKMGGVAFIIAFLIIVFAFDVHTCSYKVSIFSRLLVTA